MVMHYGITFNIVYYLKKKFTKYFTIVQKDYKSGTCCFSGQDTNIKEYKKRLVSSFGVKPHTPSHSLWPVYLYYGSYYSHLALPVIVNLVYVLTQQSRLYKCSSSACNTMYIFPKWPVIEIEIRSCNSSICLYKNYFRWKKTSRFHFFMKQMIYLLNIY